MMTDSENGQLQAKITAARIEHAKAPPQSMSDIIAEQIAEAEFVSKAALTKDWIENHVICTASVCEAEAEAEALYFTLEEFCRLTGYSVALVAELLEGGALTTSEFHAYPAFSSACVAIHNQKGESDGAS